MLERSCWLTSKSRLREERQHFAPEKRDGQPETVHGPLIASVIVLGIGLAGGGVSAPANGSSEVPRPLDVKVVAVEHASGYQARRNYLGRIESSRDSRISFEFGGKINVMLFDEGQVVKQGDIMATLDTEILESNFNTLTAQIKSAQAQLDELVAGPRREDIAASKANVRRWESQLKLAQVTKKRMLRLLKSRSVSDQEADESIYREQTVAAQLDLATANLKELVNGSRIEQVEAQRAALNQLEAQRDTISIQIKKSQLLAPFTGIIVTRLLDEGEVISVGQPVFKLVDNQCLEARIGLPVSSIEYVSTTQEQELVYAGHKFKAKLRSVKPEKNSQTRTVDVVFDLSQLPTEPAIGDIIRIELKEPKNMAGFWVPTSALVETYRGLWGCYVASHQNSDSRLAVSKLRELEVLHQSGEKSFVRGALVEGDRVIISGVHRLVNEQSVRVLSKNTPATIANLHLRESSQSGWKGTTQTN